MSKYAFAALAGIFGIGLAPVHADDYAFVVEALPQHLQGRAEQQSNQLLLQALPKVAQYFIAGIKVWDTRQPIRVCFFGGTQGMRARIAHVAMDWTAHGGYVPFDFGNIDAPRTCSPSEMNQIRIGFQYKGYWSTVGTDSVNLAAQYEESMNFALFDVNPPPEPTFTRVVLHEFGHALGFQHEHQAPTAPCASEFNWDAIYAYLQGPPNYWSVEQIDHNLRPINAASGDAALFDKASIMLYSFPPNFYKVGTKAECYTPGNNVISQVDVDAILNFYPADVAAQARVQQAGLSAYFQQIDSLSTVSEVNKSVAKLTASQLSQPDAFGAGDAAIQLNNLKVQQLNDWRAIGVGNPRGDLNVQGIFTGNTYLNGQ